MAATVQKRLERSTRLLNNLKNHGKRILIFSYANTFISDPVFNKQNDRDVTFGTDVSEHHKAATTKHPASIMMLCVVTSNRGEEASGLV